MLKLRRGSRTVLIVSTICFALVMFTSPSISQDTEVTADAVASESLADGEESEPIGVADKISIDPTSSDQKIADRLFEILVATEWFISPSVEVSNGVAFLSGVADSTAHQQWAEDMAMRTVDVVAVVNRIDVVDKPLWNFAPAIGSLRQLVREATGLLPLVLVALAIAVVAYFLARFGAAATRWLAHNRIDSTLLRQVLGNVVGVLIFIVGIYVALRVSGLTRLAVTLLGGTGLVGLALGFAFRDIAENYLASILLSLNHPFRVGDLIEVDGSVGFVRRMTTRGTILNTFEGNQIQLPNSTVYKGKIVNFTATSLRRTNFGVGIGFEDSIVDAQSIIMGILAKHPAVANDPAPMAIVEKLGSATVNLQVYFWVDQKTNSMLKVSSSVIRQIKQALVDARISMPDEAREIVFPNGVPVKVISDKSQIGVQDDSDRQTKIHSSVNDERTIEPMSGTEDYIESQSSNLSSDDCSADRSEVSVGEGDFKSEKHQVSEVTKHEDDQVQTSNLIADVDTVASGH